MSKELKPGSPCLNMTEPGTVVQCGANGLNGNSGNGLERRYKSHVGIDRATAVEQGLLEGMEPQSTSSHPCLSYKRQSNNDDKSTAKSKQTQQKVIIVGISGCSSSGKSTLAFLLNTIFNIPASNSHSAPAATKIINQDNFFKRKASMPTTTFLSADTDTDRTFVRQCMEKADEEEAGLYSFKPCSIERGGDGRCDRGVGERWEVTGPDSDCAAAVDFEAMVNAIRTVEAGGSTDALDEEREKKGLGLVEETGEGLVGEAKNMGKKMWYGLEDMEGLNERYGRLILEMKAAVGHGLKQRNLRFCFVEGFLLFTPSLSSPSPLHTSSTDLHQASAPEGITSPPNNREQQQTASQRQKLMSVLKVPLFLPTSRSAAKSRRFARKCYKDPPLGYRIPGQLWKSEGYFEEVVWGGYEREFKWLLDGESGDEGGEPGRKMGVWIREGGEDIGVEETVRWAVGVILHQVGKT